MYDEFVNTLSGWIGGVDGDDTGFSAGESNLDVDGTQINDDGTKWIILLTCYAASSLLSKGNIGRWMVYYSKWISSPFGEI